MIPVFFLIRFNSHLNPKEQINLPTAMNEAVLRMDTIQACEVPDVCIVGPPYSFSFHCSFPSIPVFLLSFLPAFLLSFFCLSQTGAHCLHKHGNQTLFSLFSAHAVWCQSKAHSLALLSQVHQAVLVWGLQPPLLACTDNLNILKTCLIDSLN